MARTLIEGTTGADTLTEATFAESDIFGFAGNDTIRLLRDDDFGGENFVDAGSGNDQVLNQFEGGNLIRLGAGNDVYVGSGFTTAGFGLDTVQAGGGADTIAVSTFFSDYFGEAGNDTFISEGWSNLFNGGAGRDSVDYRFRTDNDNFADSALAIDLGQGKAFTGTSCVETLVSIENATGTQLGDQIFGSVAANRLDGFNGSDQIAGLAGADTLLGGGGADAIDGGFGNDRIAGQQGSDLMAGGAGADRFVFDTRLGAPDEIVDFAAGVDTIVLDNAVFRGLAAGALADNRFHTGANATDAADRVLYDAESGQVLFDADGSGAAAAGIIAVLTPGRALTADDFAVI